MDMNKDKYVDESWKEQAEEEKTKFSSQEEQSEDASLEAGSPVHEHSSHDHDHCGCSGEDHGDGEDFEMNFLNYVTSLGYQAMIFMGDIPNPITNEKDKNFDQAKFLVDTLIMLKEKTAGNLNEQESNLLENSIYELQMRYIQITQEDAPGTKEAS